MVKPMMVRWLTFDVYSALFDFRASLRPELAAACGGEDAERVAAMLECWRSRQLALAMQHALLQRGHLSFRRATRLALDSTLTAFDLDLPESARALLVTAWDGLEPWPEAPRVLEQLRQRGYKLALLSNGDQDMLEALAARLPAMDAVFSAERAGAYKPHPNVYWFAVNRLGEAPGRLLHVAGSATDVMGARAAGLRCAWSNRSGDTPLDPDFMPHHELSDLCGLLPLLESYRLPNRGTTDSAR